MARERFPALVVRRGAKRKLAVAASALERTLKPGGAIAREASKFPGAALRQLVRAAPLAAHAATAALVETRSLPSFAARLGNIGALLADSLSAGALASQVYKPEMARQLAAAAAIGAHASLTGAYSAGLDRRGGRVGTALPKAVAAAEADYEQALSALRGAAFAGAPAAALSVHRENADAIQDLADLCERVARAAAGGSAPAGRLGVRTCMLARRRAMLAAASLMLHADLLSPAGVRRARRAAASAARIRRREPDAGLARTRLGTDEAGTRRSVFGKVTTVRWYERPRKPYSAARLESGVIVYVPHKNMKSHGVARGRHLVATGKVKLGKLGVFLETEFEGPAQNAKAVWEDWLATLAKPAYELHPGTLLMAWEFARLKRLPASADLLCRIPRKAGA